MSARFAASTAALVLTVVVLLAALAGSREVMAESHWPIQWIEVRGEFQRVSAEQVRAAAVPRLQDGFFGIDLAAVQTHVEALPWVRVAEVRKVWPDQLIIQVDEHRPLARWGEAHLVSELGDVFTVEGGVAIEGLPELAGPEGSALEVIDFFARMRQALLPTGLDVVSLDLSPRGGWGARLSDGMTLTIGRDEPLERLGRLAGTLDDLRADPTRRPIAVDLRYPNGFAVRWRAVEEAAELIATTAEEPEA